MIRIRSLAAAALLSAALLGPTLLGPALVGADPALATPDAFEELSDPSASAEDLAETLKRVSVRISRGESRVRRSFLTYCAESDQEQRNERASQLMGMIGRGSEALETAGFDSSGNPPDLIVIEVPHRGGPQAVRASDGHSLLLRTGSAGAAPARSRRELPKLKERDDGPPVERDVLDAAASLRVELWGRANGAASGGTSTSSALARYLIAWEGPGDDAPPWLRAGFEDWLAARIADTALSAPTHACGDAVVTVKLGDAIDDKAPDATRRGLLARLVGHLIQHEQKLADVKVGAGLPSSTFAADFGMELGAVEKALAPKGEATDVCEDGTLACTICEGSGKLDVACPDCRGTAGVGCPSCFGVESCPSSTCQGGWHYYVGSGKKAKCSYCGGDGKVSCKACSGKGATKCAACRGGKVARDCPGCENGRIPCPESGTTDALLTLCGESESATCPWCAPPGLKMACDGCGGAKATGCRRCRGRTKTICGECGGTGQSRMVYADGTVASSTKCGFCNGKGGTRCSSCKGGKSKCTDCSGKGRVGLDPDECAMCEGTQETPSVAATLAARRDRYRPPTKDEAKAIEKSMEDAVDFLLTCRTSGSFALRDFRSGRNSRVGKLREPTTYANAQVLWTLSTTGITREDQRVKAAWKELRKQGRKLVVTDPQFVGTQAASLTLRALIGGGEEVDGDLVKGLVKLIVDGQSKNGLWAGTLDDPEDGEAFQGLFAIESLWLAQRRGAKVPRSVFGRAFRASSKLFTSRGMRDDDYVTATSVASATAMIVIAKAGELGKKSGTFDYEGLTGVKRGLAWLDRYFDIRQQPIISSGAFVPSTSDGGYAAYLFAVQRLAMLLSIEVLGGERWYATGARHLLELQYDDGSFEERSGRLNGPVRTSSMALLFLGRVTPAVTDD